MSTLVRRQRPMLVDLLDWFEGGLPALPAMRSLDDSQMMRVEDFLQEGHYVLRAELPGVDPEKDVKVIVDDGVLTVAAERREEKREGQRSEFRYGAFTRSLSLPTGADENDITASYHDGVLEVRVGLKEEPKAEAKKIPVTTG